MVGSRSTYREDSQEGERVMSNHTRTATATAVKAKAKAKAEVVVDASHHDRALSETSSGACESSCYE